MCYRDLVLLNILQDTGQPPTTEGYWAPDVKSTKLSSREKETFPRGSPHELRTYHVPSFHRFLPICLYYSVPDTGPQSRGGWRGYRCSLTPSPQIIS